MHKLTIIQSKLKAPKNQFNKFGGYAYRSCEDILEALKPLLAEQDCHLILKDEVILIGTRYYVRAEAYLFDGEKLIGSSTAYAREEEERKGMSGGQCTAASSSFARKYCLCGMFLCDDTKDPDFYPPENKPQKEVKDSKTDQQRQKEIEERISLMKQNNLLQAKKFQGDLKEKMIDTINDPKFNSINGQETLAKRIKEQLLKQIENLPPAPPKPSVKNSHFSIPVEEKKKEIKEEKKEDKKPEDFF